MMPFQSIRSPGSKTELLEEKSQEYFRPQSAVYREPGGFSHKTGRYPVSSKALEEYLRHQSSKRRESLAAVKDGELRHRSRVQKIALDILGTAKRVKEEHKEEFEKVGKENVMKVLGELQNEISLDTEAISAFR